MGKISLKEKFAIDAQRETAEQRHIIHLFREGKFFRAFNYSAWLLMAERCHFADVCHTKQKSSEKAFVHQLATYQNLKTN